MQDKTLISVFGIITVKGTIADNQPESKNIEGVQSVKFLVLTDEDGKQFTYRFTQKELDGTRVYSISPEGSSTPMGIDEIGNGNDVTIISSSNIFDLDLDSNTVIQVR